MKCLLTFVINWCFDRNDLSVVFWGKDWIKIKSELNKLNENANQRWTFSFEEIIIIDKMIDKNNNNEDNNDMMGNTKSVNANSVIALLAGVPLWVMPILSCR